MDNKRWSPHDSSREEYNKKIIEGEELIKLRKQVDYEIDKYSKCTLRIKELQAQEQTDPVKEELDREKIRESVLKMELESLSEKIDAIENPK